MRARSLSLLVATAAVSCSLGSSHLTLVGLVTTVTPRLCLGAPQATGDCFVASASQVAALRIGECLRVKYTPLSGAGPRGRVVSVAPLQKAPSVCHP
jgi:hypothetical protein